MFGHVCVFVSSGRKNLSRKSFWLMDTLTWTWGEFLPVLFAQWPALSPCR